MRSRAFIAPLLPFGRKAATYRFDDAVRNKVVPGEEAADPELWPPCLQVLLYALVVVPGSVANEGRQRGSTLMEMDLITEHQCMCSRARGR